MKKVRLDDLLIERGYFTSRDEVVRSVIAREVRVDDVYVTSAAVKVLPSAEIYVKGCKNYVSRGGHKLEAALRAFNVPLEGKRCIDIGSSTGGFTDCLLQAGAAEVTCVDVNYGQLAWQLRQDPRVVVFERTNIRTAVPQELGAPFDVMVCDLSFIGIAQLAPVFAALGKAGSLFVGLIKPQFESKHEETERGIVVDEAVRERVVHEVTAALEDAGFEVEGVIDSPIRGAKGGNKEFLCCARLTHDPQEL